MNNFFHQAFKSPGHFCIGISHLRTCHFLSGNQHPRNTQRKAEHRNDDSREYNKMPREQRPRNARRNVEHREDQGAQYTAIRRTQQPRNTQRNAEHHKAEHRNNDSIDYTKLPIKMFDDLDPPDEDGVNTFTRQLHKLAYKRKTLNWTQYAKIDWPKELDFQQFQAQCNEEEYCFFKHYRGKKVPIPCDKHRQGTNQMWRLKKRHEEIVEEERVRKWRQARKEDEEKETALTRRARAENPDLLRLKKIWLPLAPGVAIIRGDMLVDVATFFCDCDITVEEHNEPSLNRRFKGKGEDIIAQVTGPDIDWEFKWSTCLFTQVRVSIDKFRGPADAKDSKHPGRAALCGLKGAHGNAMCGLILFLGSTGEPASEKIDKECSYWIYSAWGFPSRDLSKIGETPFRMVRLANVRKPDTLEIMVRFDLATGKERAKSFCENFGLNLRPWKATPVLWKDFHRWGDLQDVFPDPSEDDDFGEDDSGEDDSSEDNSSEDGESLQADPQEENADNSENAENAEKEDEGTMTLKSPK